MSHNPKPALDAFIATLISHPTTVETFVVSDGESEAVRLLVTEGGTEIAVDVEVFLSPAGCGHYHLDPRLTSDSRFALMEQGVLPDDHFAAMVQGSQIASALTVAHRDVIARTARERFAHHVM